MNYYQTEGVLCIGITPLHIWITVLHLAITKTKQSYIHTSYCYPDFIQKFINSANDIHIKKPMQIFVQVVSYGNSTLESRLTLAAANLTTMDRSVMHCLVAL